MTRDTMHMTTDTMHMTRDTMQRKARRSEHNRLGAAESRIPEQSDVEWKKVDAEWRRLMLKRQALTPLDLAQADGWPCHASSSPMHAGDAAARVIAFVPAAAFSAFVAVAIALLLAALPRTAPS
eukprot:5128332-Pleurochrysis_carterae.AAC.3